MSRELLLARRLIEAAADPYAAPFESEQAVAELAALDARFALESGYPVQTQAFEGLRAADLSPSAWILFLENASPNDPEVPTAILEALFQETLDEVIRLRLVGGVLSHPRVAKDYDAALGFQPAPIDLTELPPCWPRERLLRIEANGRAGEADLETSPRVALQEMALYLLQDGSPAARALAAAAIAPDEGWRNAALVMVRGFVRRADPDLQDWGAAFARARV